MLKLSPAMKPPNARTKWTLVALFWIAQGFVGFLVWNILFFDPFGRLSWSILWQPAKALGPNGSVLPWAVVAGILAITALQAVFLVPVRRPVLGDRGIPLWVSFVVGGLAGAGLITAAALAIVDLTWIAGPGDPSLLRHMPWTIGALALTSWAVATPLLYVFTRRGRPESRLGRIAARLFLGTVVETAAIIPLDVLVRRRQTCYCEQGTFWALTICLSVGLFALGPAVLLPLLSRRRKRWYAGRCEACGYDMAGTPGAERCPECGAGWKAG